MNGAAGKRVGALVECLGANPALVVVERAMCDVQGRKRREVGRRLRQRCDPVAVSVSKPGGPASAAAPPA